MDILKEIFYGNVSGAERRMTRQEKIKADKECDAYEKMKEQLSTKDMQSVENYIQARDTRESLTELNAYKYGFKTGIQIASQSYITE